VGCQPSCCFGVGSYLVGHRFVRFLLLGMLDLSTLWSSPSASLGGEEDDFRVLVVLPSHSEVFGTIWLQVGTSCLQRLGPTAWG
jgi:hypothetical protein